jgi:hypothetical protein
MARMQSEDFIGTCQWCFGEYKVNGSRNVVLHGYTRPGHGYTVGNCPGYDHQPFEYAHDLTDQRITMLKEGIAKNERQIKMIDDGKVERIANPSYEPETSKKWEHAYRYGLDDENRKTHLTPEDRRFGYYLRAFRAQLESDNRFDQGVVDFLAKEVAAWKKKPIVGLDSPATGKERYLRGAYDPDKAAEAAAAAERKAARDAKPGKITLTVYATLPDRSLPDFADPRNPTQAEMDVRRKMFDEEHAAQKQFKTALKEWTKATFPADKYWVGDVYDGDVRSVRKDLRQTGGWTNTPQGKVYVPLSRRVDIVAAATKIDWKYLDQVLDMFPEHDPIVVRRDNSAKDVRIFIDASAFPAKLLP